MERLSGEDLVTQQNVAAYVRGLVAWARVTGPRSVLNRPAIGLHFAFNLLYLPLLPVQLVSTFILGLLVRVTLGLLLIPLSVVLWWPFLGFLLGSSWLWGKVGLSRPVLLLPGVAVAEVASAVVGLMPSMGEWQSRGMKLALCESWPHSLSLWKGHLSGLL
jgi:hypothetical protein